MVLELVFELIFGVINIFLDLIPTLSLSDDFELGLNSIGEVTSLFAYFLPMQAVSSCLFIYLLITNAKFIISIFNFVIRKIPFIN